MRHDAWAGALLWWNCQSPVAHSCSLLNHWNSFRRGMFKLNAKFNADLSLYSLSYFKCDGHTIHMLTQWHLPPPLTSTVKSSLFTHAHSSPLFFAARLHGCCANLLVILTMVGLFLDRPRISSLRSAASRNTGSPWLSRSPGSLTGITKISPLFQMNKWDLIMH